MESELVIYGPKKKKKEIVSAVVIHEDCSYCNQNHMLVANIRSDMEGDCSLPSKLYT